MTPFPAASHLELFGHALGNFSAPGPALASAFLLGFLMGAIPLGAAEVLVLLLAGLEPRVMVVPLVLVMTAGHVGGKLLWYLAGAQHHRITHRWLRRQVDAAELYMRARPKLGLGALAMSALVSVPPFHLTAIGAGVLRSPVLVFSAVAFVGRALRFGALATVPHLVPFLLP